MNLPPTPSSVIVTTTAPPVVFQIAGISIGSPTSVQWAQLTGIPSSFNPSPHRTTHVSTGSDPISVANAGATGLMPALTGTAGQYLDYTGSWSSIAYSSLTGTPSTFSPSPHASTHITGGSDIIAAVAATTSGLVPSPASAALQGLRTNSSGVPAWRALDFVNVVLWGADPTGAADSTTAIQNAINSLPSGGGIVFFPPGTFKISSALTLNKQGRYIGSGAFSTTITTTSATADMFVVAANYMEICHLGFFSSVTRTAGSCITYSALWTGIYVHNFYMSAPYIGVKVGWSGGDVSNGVIVNGVSGGAGLRIDGVGTGNVQFRNLVIQACDSGIVITQNNGTWFQNVGVYSSTLLALSIAPASGALLTALYFNQCMFDTNTGAQSLVVLFSSGAGSTIQDTKFTDCWIVSGKQRGLLTTTASSGVIDGVALEGCTVIHSQQEGILISDSGTVNFKLANSYVCNNGTSGTFDGIRLPSGVSQFSIIGNRIGNGLTLAGNTAYGINLQGSNTNCIITDNDLRGNTSGDQFGSPTGSSVAVNNLSTGLVWTAVTLTITPGAGAITTQSSSCAYLQMGKTIFLMINVTVTTIGTASGSTTLSGLPVAVKRQTAFMLRETVINGLVYSWTIAGSATSGVVVTSANVAPAWTNGITYAGVAVYESV